VKFKVELNKNRTVSQFQTALLTEIFSVESKYLHSSSVAYWESNRFTGNTSVSLSLFRLFENFVRTGKKSLSIDNYHNYYFSHYNSEISTSTVYGLM
jgi:hypothetical protein